MVDFLNYIVQDFFYLCLNDMCEVFFGNFFVVLIVQAGNGDDLVVVYFFCQCGVKFYFQFFCLWFYYGVVFFDVFGDYIVVKGNYCSVLDDVFLEDGNICGVIIDVNECYVGFFFFFIQYCRS